MEDSLLAFNGPRQRDDFRRRLVHMLAHYYEHLTARLSPLPDDRHVFVDMRQLTVDLRQTVEWIYDRLGLAMDTDFEQRLDEAHQRARSYKSAHRYDLEQFGLDAQVVSKEFAHAFDNFDFESPAEGCRASSETASSV
jgi:hypothetical protein